MNARILPVIATALFALSACGGSSEPTATSPSVETSETSSESTGGDVVTSTVTITNSRFDQLELRVAPGTTVSFVNTDPFGHTITSADDSPVEFDSGEFGQDETFEFTFDEAGEYAYFCQIHPTMRAVVIVG